MHHTAGDLRAAHEDKVAGQASPIGSERQ
jgi:hypothetical protein